MNASSNAAILDVDYRKMVSDAAGEAYLDTMTSDCLRQVEAFIAGKCAPGDTTRSQAHRLAGGTATVGLPRLAATLKAIETACTAPPPHEGWSALQADCEAGLREAYAAVGADASTRSSR